MTEDEMVGWHHRPYGHKYEQLRETGKDREGWHAAVHGIAELYMIQGLNNSCLLSKDMGCTLHSDTLMPLPSCLLVPECPSPVSPADQFLLVTYSPNQ